MSNRPLRTECDTDTIIGNPGFPSINQNILFSMDHNSQMAFRQVCQSWRKQVDQPFFWIKKLNLKRNSREVGKIWIGFVRKIQLATLPVLRDL